MECRNFVARNSEHLIAGVHLWYWIYYDFAFIFPQRNPKFGPSSIFLNSTSHGIMCLMLLCVLRSLKDVQMNQEYKITRYNSFSTFTFSFAIHFVLSILIIDRIDHELVLPKAYGYISPNWLKYVIRTYITTFFSIELLLLLRYSINLPSKIEVIISTIGYFVLIFTIRILFHIQITYD